MALPLSATGSLSPTFVPARDVSLAVRLPSAFALCEWFPTILREPLDASVTLLEATAPVKLPSYHCPLSRFLDSGLEFQYYQGGIPQSAPHTLTTMSLRLPPILYGYYRNSMISYSKALRGLSVQSRVTSIFTSTTISPSALSRQCPSRYAIRAGRNLPDKEFRYLRTVIVTAAVHWGFGSMLLFRLHFPLTFQHWAGVSPYTSAFAFAETCVFVKQSLGPLFCHHLHGTPSP